MLVGRWLPVGGQGGTQEVAGVIAALCTLVSRSELVLWERPRLKAALDLDLVLRSGDGGREGARGVPPSEVPTLRAEGRSCHSCTC